jgi:serine/threonine protein kinase
LADAGDLSLATVAKPLAVEDLVGLGLGLARAVAGMHRRGVMHHDLCPANIMVGGEGAPCLVGFGWPRGWPRPGRISPLPVRSWGPWRIWRRSKPGAPVERWTSAPICTRWA